MYILRNKTFMPIIVSRRIERSPTPARVPLTRYLYSKMAYKTLIENPAPGGRAETTGNRARRFVRAGQAVFTGERTIRFVRDEAGIALLRMIEETAVARIARGSGVEYDRVKRCFDRELPHIPVVNPAKMVRQEKSSRNWSFSAGVEQKRRRDHTAAEVAAMRKAR
jgi:hypothetical protein